MKRTMLIKAAIVIMSLAPFSALQAKKMTILVYPFENTGDQRYSWVSAGMTDTVISDLCKIKHINVVSEEDRKKSLNEIDLARKGLVDVKGTVRVGKMTGADIIFTGTYIVIEKRIRVFAKLIDVESGRIEQSLKIDGSMDRIFEFQDRIVFNLMAETEKVKIANVNPVQFTEEDKKRINAAVRPDIEAFRLYSKGLELKDSNPREALEYFRKALRVQGDYLEALFEAGVTAGRELSRFQEAFGFLDRAQRIFAQRGDTSSKHYAALMHRTGSVYLSKGDLDRSIEYLRTSQRIRKNLDLVYTNEYSNLLIEIGWYYFSRFKYDQALDSYFESQKIKDRMKLQNSPDYSILLNVIGSVYYSRGRKDTALEYYLKSKKVREHLGLELSAEYASLLNNISNVYMDKGNPDAALEYLDKARIIKEKLGLQDTIGYGFIYLNMGHAHVRKGNRDQAGKCYRKAYTVYEKAGYTGYEKKAALDGAVRLGY